ncbi:LytR/AlgR family response regulator transcription factor [Labilibaculum euxinus]|uniref:LytR/AlgR family response regulator transcription factor n=1 Tax=Labilibaculum euxinus TaxID=2686357 RepID=UPI0012E191B8|nr:LytTR family DNA-binding domain-containing protein [Labilibaculum euxinus]
MIKVAIVEDERLAARELEKMLLDIRPDKIEVKAHLENVEQAVQYLSGHKLDLIFMDIHLGDGNSFEIFDRLEITTPVIFTTAYDQYAVQAFKQCSVDYLLKPMDSEDVEAAIIKFETMFQEKESLDFSALQKSLNSLMTGDQYQERFMVSRGDRLSSLEVEKVAYFMADGKALYLFGLDGNRYLFDGTLTSLESKLNPKRFFRVNRKFIVSYQAIEDMHYYSKNRIKLNLKPNHPECIDAIVSQDRCTEFKKWLNQ